MIHPIQVNKLPEDSIKTTFDMLLCQVHSTFKFDELMVISTRNRISQFGFEVKYIYTKDLIFFSLNDCSFSIELMLLGNIE